MNDQLRAARALRTTIRATRQETEESRRLAPQVVEGLIAAGLCRLAVPASLGGHEAEPGVALQIYEVLAGADASVAWIAWNNQLVGLASRYSSDAVRTEVFSDARRLFANSTRPSGRAVVVEGGFRVSGRWALVSGCELADWIPVMCVVTEGTEPRMLPAGEPEMRMAYLPQGSYRILDTWHVGGCGAPEATISSWMRCSSLRSGPFLLQSPLKTIGRCLECHSSPQCAQIAPLTGGNRDPAPAGSVKGPGRSVSRDAGSSVGPNPGRFVSGEAGFSPTATPRGRGRRVGRMHSRDTGDGHSTGADVGERTPRRARGEDRGEVHG
jgi:Acyl-CoA dehydrogenase, N-terminal domain